MPRPIEFDRTQALNDAMLLFWRQGYHNTSVRDLTDATRLKPGSLYGAFSSKRTLFLKSLDFYSEALRAAVDGMLRNDSSPLERIEYFFNRLVEETERDPQQKGCLLVNTLLETPFEDREITKKASEGLIYVEKTFAELLEEARRNGELPSLGNTEAQARVLMSAIFGLRVYARMHPAPGTLASITTTILDNLRKAN
ncbi:MAG: TetR/AcrR family transcriptional regulator [Chromatiales bacterium]|nr:TetR/AcrR family transcriptional regulator [Chromatiales bacterium]